MAKMKKTLSKEIIENEMDVKIEDFCDKLELEILHKGSKEYIHFSTFNVSRPGLQMAGYYEHFSPDRVQVIGEQEMSFLKTMSSGQRTDACEKFFSHKIPCLVVSTVLEPLPEIMEAAKKFDAVVLRSSLRTTMFMNSLSLYLNDLLAPLITIHGVLMDIYGVGVLIIGNSSVGKSETALELIQRNHRLVADDAVTIKRVSDQLVGASPSIIRYFMEVRGLGIIDIRSMYGAGAVKHTKEIDLVIKLEEWDTSKEYDRLGNIKEVHSILDVELPMHTVPVKPGRNLAVILEVAARNYRLKTFGYDTLKELDERLKGGKPANPFEN